MDADSRTVELMEDPGFVSLSLQTTVSADHGNGHSSQIKAVQNLVLSFYRNLVAGLEIFDSLLRNPQETFAFSVSGCTHFK